ncbi:MAG: hypothetical protein ABSD96_14475 [Candidatus Korobacteraceae bacterium]
MAASVVPGLNTEPCVAVNRCLQNCAGIVAMMAIANLQNAWTPFTKSLSINLNTAVAVIQVAFAASILAETWLVPIEGYMIDRLGPRAMLAFTNRNRIGAKGRERHG